MPLSEDQWVLTLKGLGNHIATTMRIGSRHTIYLLYSDTALNRRAVRVMIARTAGTPMKKMVPTQTTHRNKTVLVFLIGSPAIGLLEPVADAATSHELLSVQYRETAHQAFVLSN